MNELESFSLAGKLNTMQGALCGIRVIEDKNMPEFRPFLELSNKVNLSDECRARVDASLLERFGTRRTIYIANGCYITHPNTVNKLKELSHD